MTEPAASSTAMLPAHESISIARLHGLACITCGAVNKRLLPAGTIEHRGRSWPIVACPPHADGLRPPLGRATSPLAQGLDQEEVLTHERP